MICHCWSNCFYAFNQAHLFPVIPSRLRFCWIIFCETAKSIVTIKIVKQINSIIVSTPSLEGSPIDTSFQALFVNGVPMIMFTVSNHLVTVVIYSKKKSISVVTDRRGHGFRLPSSFCIESQ